MRAGRVFRRSTVNEGSDMMERVREGATVDGEGTVKGHRCMERIA